MSLPTQSLLPSEDSWNSLAWHPRPSRTCLLPISPIMSYSFPFFFPSPFHTAGQKLCSHPSASLLTCFSCWAHLSPSPSQNSAQEPSHLRRLCWQCPHLFIVSGHQVHLLCHNTFTALMTLCYGRFFCPSPWLRQCWKVGTLKPPRIWMLPPTNWDLVQVS